MSFTPDSRESRVIVSLPEKYDCKSSRKTASLSMISHIWHAANIVISSKAKQHNMRVRVEKKEREQRSSMKKRKERKIERKRKKRKNSGKNFRIVPFLGWNLKFIPLGRMSV